MLTDIKEFVEKWKKGIRSIIKSLGLNPTFGIIQVGNNEASNRYVKNKIKDCQEIGILPILHKYDEDITEEELIEKIKANAEMVDAIMVQLPLPPQINFDNIKSAIPREKDVDGFVDNSLFESCTPKGIIVYLIECCFLFSGKNITVIGRSDIVGKPLAKMLTDLDATVTLCHSKTKDIYKHCENADLVICAVGKANFLDCSRIDCPVVDVGINFNEEGKMCGDCYNTEGKEVTPVPGGVGLLTRAALLNNILLAVMKAKENN